MVGPSIKKPQSGNNYVAPFAGAAADGVAKPSVPVAQNDGDAGSRRK